MEIGFSGRETSQIDVDHDWGINPTLLDFYADTPVPGLKSVYIRTGQFKTPFGRENLSYSRYFLFTQRSINQLFLGLGRDYGGDFVLRLSAGKSYMSVEGELTYGKVSNDYGEVSTYGGRIQGSYLWNNLELALRLAFLKPDKAFGSHLNPALPEPIGDKAIKEIAPSLVYYHKKQNVKLTVDLPIIIDAPVVIEQGLGTYVLLDQTDVIGYIGNPVNVIERQTVTGLRITLQLGF